MMSVNANAISYICGRQYPGCHCRSSTVLNNVGQIGDGDLDVATVVAAMEIAEQDEEQTIFMDPQMTVLTPLGERLERQAQQAQQSRAEPVLERVTLPTRPARPATPMPAAPRPVTHVQPIPGVLPNETAQLQQYRWPASRASAQSCSNRAVLTRPRRPARPMLSGTPVPPARSSI